MSFKIIGPMPTTNLVRPSRDGDQFHYLWAARRCLSLLSPQTGLVAVSIEGPSPDELPAVSAALAGEELIDIAEYYGDEDVGRAQLVRYMQLKHSTRHADEPWTASGLEKTLAGFSKRYKDLLKRFSADDLVKRFEFYFVTNRPISADITETLTDAANGVVQHHPKELEKLERFTGLNGVALSEFCKLICFEDRQDDYWDQRNILSQDVGGYLPDSDVDAPIQLKELVTRKALSESEKNPIITKMDVLRALKTDESRLYPAPCMIKAIDNAIPREQEADLIQEIVRADKRPVIVHALGGVGKSVFSTRIANGLPQGSVSVLYDCFGNGQYRSASGYRHRHQDALVQIANELAAKGLCHPLIPTVHADTSAYLRAFSYRLQQAITFIRLAEPHALLCIIVDAADNAQMAAEEIWQARSFARDLLRETPPDGVRLVFLCRSHRQDVLDPPPDALRLELKPFTRTETATYLRQVFPHASEQDVDEFHRLSSHNPRVQALALSRKQSLSETLRLLGPNPTTVESAIGSLLSDAISKLRDSVGQIEKERIGKICAGLAALRPLIPIPVLSRMSGVSEEAIRSFALDLGRPLLVTDVSIQFLDEPVETWFREQFRPSSDELAEFIRGLTPLAAKSAYVASTLPQLMLEAGQFSELVTLALTSAALPDTSLLEKRDVELQRLQFALKASLRTKRYVDAAKLALKAGGETAGDDRQRKLIEANTDLAARFIETELIQEIVSRRSFGSGWIGSHHAYEAGLMSGRTELTGDARSRLRMAYEWLSNWSRLTSEEREEEKVSETDIAELCVAELNIHGASESARNLRRWRPREVSFRVGRIVASRLIDHGRLSDLSDLAIAAGNDLGLVLAIIVELRKILQTPPSEVVRRAFKLVSHTRVNLKESEVFDHDEAVLDTVTALVEAALKLSVCSHVKAAALLKRYLPATPPRGLSSRFSNSRLPLLRAYCIKAALEQETLQLTDLAYPELKVELEKVKQYQSSQDVREFRENIGACLPWYQLWAAALLGEITKEGLPDRLEQTRTASAKVAGMYYQDEFDTSNEVAPIWFEILFHLNALEVALLSLLTSWIRNLKRPLFTRTLTAIARLGAQKDETKEMALRFAAESFALTRDERADAESKSNDYIEVARSILAISVHEAKAYFNEAVAVASKIGGENLSRWDAILDLADRAARQDRPVPEVAYLFARCAELTRDYVDRDKHFAWRSTVKALSALCPSSTFAILSRWRDRGFGWRGRVLPTAIHYLIERGDVDPRDVLALVCFEAEWDYSKLLSGVLNKCADRSEREAACSFFLRYVKWERQSSSVWKELREVTARYGLSIPDVDSRIAFTEHEERSANERQVDHQEERGTSSEHPDSKWDNIFFGNDLTTADGISQSYAAFKSTPVPWSHDQFFAEAILRVPVGNEAAFIEAAGNTPELNLYSFRDFLGKIPDAWKGRPSIKHGLEATIKAVCRRFCMDINRNRYYEVLPFDLACSLAGIREVDIVDVVLDAIGESQELLDPNRLFSMLGLLTSKLSHDEALETLSFGLSLFDPVLEGSDGDGPWSGGLVPPVSIQASIAGYIYAGLAAPSAMLRWEAAHSVLGLCEFGRDEVLRHLVSCSEAKSGGPFADARLPFYELHARQWLLLAFARGASEFPAALGFVANRLVDWALNDQPHVMIRQFAARAALALIKNGTLVVKESVCECLARVNVSSFPFVESKSYQRIPLKTRNAEKAGDEDSFYFGIDMGPYWYEPLGRVFALSQREIETEALKVIRKELNYLAKGAWNEDERGRRNLYRHKQTYASHGSYPDTDDYQFYLAYHAMMIVAGRLLATTPTHRDTEWGEQDEFAEWLSRHDLSRSDGRWLADRRDPAPLEWPAWRDHKKEDQAYGVVTPMDFEQALRSGDILNVWGGWSTADSAREQTVHVRSALVSSDKSMALLRALSTAKDVRDYLIPSANDDHQIDMPGFKLKGWIEDCSHDQGLDGKDRWSGGIHFPPPIPTGEIVDLMAIETDLDKRVWRDGTKAPVMSSQVWGYLEERNEDNNPERGERLQASLNFIKDMLGKLTQDMIIEVQIERRRRYRSYESQQDDERIPTATKLYLIKLDGSITTL